MFVKTLLLENFKRFTSVVIDLSSLGKHPKLVMLIGANGSGKSCVFDAFENLASSAKGSPYNVNHPYFNKGGKNYSIKAVLQNKDDIIVEVSDSSVKRSSDLPSSAFYGRSSLRQVPVLTNRRRINSLPDLGQDVDRPRLYIERDSRFLNDIDRLTEQILKEVFNRTENSAQIIDKYILPINDAFARIFGAEDHTSLKLVSLIPPLERKAAQIIFKKGTSEIHYDYLSSGEKEVFNILLNLHTRREFFTNTIYFIDELDLHLNTSLQKALLKEIVERWIPDGCQLWTASHSLGFIEYANESDNAVIIDFDSLDFDQPQILKPGNKDSTEIFEIAVPKDSLQQLLSGKRLFFAENTDTRYYNGLNIKSTIFIGATNKDDVFHKVRSGQYNGLIDRDYLLDEERALIAKTYPGLVILELYSVENYLYHPDNIEEYSVQTKTAFDKDAYIAGIIESKNQNLTSLVYRIQNARTSYPFFKESGQENNRKKYLAGGEYVVTLLKSDTFKDFYPVFPMKDQATTLSERQNIDKQKLAQTSWFKQQIENILNNNNSL